jgi:hypothetical protein
VVELVSAAWPADQVVGRQVLLTFQPPQRSKAILDSGLASLPVRVPVLRVRGAPGMVALGPLMTVHGDALGPSNMAPTPGTDMAGRFGALKVLSDSDRTAAFARVT